MTSQTIVQIMAPLTIAILMWGVGLSLSWEDFNRVRKNPKMILFAMLTQLCLVPLFAIALNWAFALPTGVAIGMLLLASTPGGTTANLFAYLSKGNVALNISLTAINTVIGMFSVPLFVYLAYMLYQDQGTTIPLQISKLTQVLLVVLIPMSLGIFTRSKKPDLAIKAEKYVGKVCFFAIVVLAIAGVAGEREKIAETIQVAGLPVLIFNLSCLGIGILVSRFMKLNLADESALVMELGIHNCVLALVIALSPNLLNDTVVAIPAALYMISMYTTALPLSLYYRRKQAAQVQTAALKKAG